MGYASITPFVTGVGREKREKPGLVGGARARGSADKGSEERADNP